MTVVRDAQPGDAPAMAKINVMGWRASFRDAVADEVIDAQRVGQRREWFEAHLPAGDGCSMSVAEEDGEVVGFANLGPTRDADAGGVRELRGLYVDPDRQRRGIGRALMAAVLADLGDDPATLWALRDVAATRRFYEAEGWRWDGTTRVEHLHGHPIQEVRYRLEGSG